MIEDIFKSLGMILAAISFYTADGPIEIFLSGMLLIYMLLWEIETE